MAARKKSSGTKSTRETFVIHHTPILPGETHTLFVPIARLASGTAIDIPVVVSRAVEPGPVVLLMGGLHGDELNGVEIMRRVLRSGYHIPLRGATISIPLVNVFGFINFSREPVFSKDVNRSFPGTSKGSLASRLAFYIHQHILPLVDVGVDLHTGGESRYNFPQVRAVLKDPVNKALAEAFSAPFTIDAPLRAGSLRHAAAKMGKHIIVYEGGETLRFDQHAIAEGVEGVQRFLQHFGMLREEATPQRKTRHDISKMSWVRAKNAGLFQPFIEPGEWVRKGQQLGIISDTLGKEREMMLSPKEGYVIGVNYRPVVNLGDALVHLGSD